MSRPRIAFAVLILLAVLLAVLVWQKDNTPRQLSSTSSEEVVSLMPFSEDWNLTDSQDAMVIFAFVPNEASTEQLQIFKEVSKKYGDNIKFASLDLTRNHASNSNAVYAELFDVTETSTIIIRRKGESTFEKVNGPFSNDSMISFVDSTLKIKRQ